jgi:uncharacterized protein YegP (UPF0339 family)
MTKVNIKIEIYKDKSKDGGEWRWRLLSTSNGNILATSGEGYKNKKDMIKTLDVLQFDFEYAERFEVESE